MPDAVNSAGVFLIETLFDLTIFVFLIRVILVATRADFFNPLSQVITKLTQWLILPLRRMIPNVKTLELASIVVVLFLEISKFSLLGWMIAGMPNIGGVCLLAIADALKSVVNIFFYGILIQALMSWVSAGYSPAAALLAKITSPIMNPLHRLIPPIGGIDITPIPAMILLQLILILVIGPLYSVGWSMAFS